MFKPARMKKLKILTLDAYSNSLISALQEEEVVQIHDISERIQQDAEWKQILKPSKVTAYTGKVSSLQMKATGIADFLKSAERKEGGILASVMGILNPKVPEKREVEDLDTEALIEHAESILGKVEGQTKPIEEKLTALDAEKSELNNALNVANKLKNIDIDLSDLEETKYTNAITGRISSTQLDEFKKEANSITDKIVILEHAEKETTVLFVITLKEYDSEISSILRKYEFELYDTSELSGKPSVIIQNAESRIAQIESEKAGLIDNLADIAEKWLDDLEVLKEQLEIEKNRNEIFASFGETEKTIMIEGWVTAKKLDEALDIINKSSDGHSIIEVTDPEDGDDIPVHLDNPRFAKPYELFVHMYSPPRYKETDPTLLFALVFPFFFGFCLTDAGYGIIDALIGLLLVFGLGKVNKVMHSLGLILTACGVWAVVLGLATNSLFGDFIPRWIMGNANAAVPTTIPMFNAFSFPQNILLWALIVGVIYTAIALIIGAMDNIRMKQYREAVEGQIVWLLVFIAIGLIGAGYMLFGGMWSIVFDIGLGLFIVTMVMQFYFNKIFGLMDYSGFLGTILSYARLLALCLATGGIATTVNIVANVVLTFFPGIIPGAVGAAIAMIIAIFITLAGHTVNCAFQTLGAFVNSMRLHYVEFFGQFYVGGSQKFRAFRARRKLTKLGGK
ncbi:V-type ATP synthase subunit I [Methanobacterium sp.]|uniref:V-type ATP synthase subunit I n=1 Tax=Methanobacterium sp. TaxID=2164 RepID=UPI003C7262B1